MIAERLLQLRFSFADALLLVALGIALFGSWQYIALRQNRFHDGVKTVAIQFSRARVDPGDVAPLKLAGAWEVAGADPRFGGFSGLALDKGRLVGLTDQGFVVVMPRPADGRLIARITDLDDGPFTPQHSWNRDAEALVRDPLGRGWWVAFEKQHELWLYRQGFDKGLKRVKLDHRRWPTNLGVEGLVARNGPELLAFSEADGRYFTIRGGKGIGRPVAGLQLYLSEAALLPDGRIVAIERGFGTRGFENRLVFLAHSPSGLKVARRIPLGVRPLDNIEGLAPEALPNGGTRLWMITDDNFQRPLRTLLLALDLPPKRTGS